jgi:hypothetical protein
MYPKSNMGRSVACLICFWGFITAAYYVVTIFNFLAFEDNQEKSYLLIMKLLLRKKVETTAVEFISLSYKMFRLKRAIAMK